MNREDIIRMAREARQGVDIYYNTDEQLEGFFERFAALVASAERERILEICKEGLWDAEGIRYHLDTQARGHVATNDTSQERVDKTSEIVHEPWSPVSIGVDITKEGAHVVGIYALDKDTSQVFYAKYYPAPQRTWVGLTPQEREEIALEVPMDAVLITEAKLKEKNT